MAMANPFFLTTASSGPPTLRTCYNCGREGHISRYSRSNSLIPLTGVGATFQDLHPNLVGMAEVAAIVPIQKKTTEGENNSILYIRHKRSYSM